MYLIKSRCSPSRYGYNGRDVKDNITVDGRGDLMYAVGHVIVLLNIQSERKQRHYKEHTAPVSWYG